MGDFDKWSDGYETKQLAGTVPNLSDPVEAEGSFKANSLKAEASICSLHEIYAPFLTQRQGLNPGVQKCHVSNGVVSKPPNARKPLLFLPRSHASLGGLSASQL